MCEFPYYRNNNTCILYSQYDYESYKNTMISFTFFNIIGMIMSILICLYTYMENDYVIKLRQKLILGIFVSFLLLFFQYIDPFGYNGWMPYLGDVLLANLSTWVSLSILFLMLFIFTKVYQRFKWQSIDSIPYVLSFSLILIMTLVCSFLQVYVNRYIWRGVKLLFLATYIIILTCQIDVYYYKMFQLLYRDDIHKKRRIIITMITFNTIMPVVVSLQYYIGMVNLIKHKEINPKITWDKIILPITHILSNFIGLIYFRGKPVISLCQFYNDMIHRIKEYFKKPEIIELKEFNHEDEK